MVPLRIILTLMFIAMAFPTRGQEPVHKIHSFLNTPGFYYQYEQGVSNRISFQDIAAFNISERIKVSAAWRFHINQQYGMGSVHFAVEEWKTGLKWLSFGGELAHLEYSDYKIGENQIALISYFSAGKRFRFGLGGAYRAPNLKNRESHSFFDWNNEANEIYPVFQLEYRAFLREQWSLYFSLGTYEFMRLQTKDHLFLKLEPSWWIRNNMKLKLDIATAVKNISGMILTVNELSILTGISFYY